MLLHFEAKVVKNENILKIKAVKNSLAIPRCELSKNTTIFRQQHTIFTNPFLKNEGVYESGLGKI